MKEQEKADVIPVDDDSLACAYYADEMDAMDEMFEEMARDYKEPDPDEVYIPADPNDPEEIKAFNKCMAEEEARQRELKAMRSKGEEQRQRFADALRTYMYKFDKNQSDIARACNVSTASVSTWCSGKKMPRPEKLLRLADYFGIKYADMMALPADVDFADLEEPQPGIVEEVDSLMRKIEKAPRPLIYGGNEIPDNIVVLLKDVLNIIQGK